MYYTPGRILRGGRAKSKWLFLFFLSRARSPSWPELTARFLRGRFRVQAEPDFARHSSTLDRAAALSGFMATRHLTGSAWKKQWTLEKSHEPEGAVGFYSVEFSVFSLR